MNDDSMQDELSYDDRSREKQSKESISAVIMSTYNWLIAQSRLDLKAPTSKRTTQQRR